MRKIKIQTKVIEGEEYFKFDNKYEEFRYFYGNLLTLILIIVLIVLGVVLLTVVFKHIDLLKTNPCKLCMDLGYDCFIRTVFIP